MVRKKSRILSPVQVLFLIVPTGGNFRVTCLSLVEKNGILEQPCWAWEFASPEMSFRLVLGILSQGHGIAADHCPVQIHCHGD